MTPNFEDFIGILFIGWVFTYFFNYMLAGVLSIFYYWVAGDRGIKIKFPK